MNSIYGPHTKAYGNVHVFCKWIDVYVLTEDMIMILIESSQVFCIDYIRIGMNVILGLNWVQMFLM